MKQSKRSPKLLVREPTQGWVDCRLEVLKVTPVRRAQVLTAWTMMHKSGARTRTHTQERGCILRWMDHNREMLEVTPGSRT